MAPGGRIETSSSMTPTTIIFDVDDTLYDVSNGFTAHRKRNGGAVYHFMMHHLGFESEVAAKALRDEYFAKYHSTAKALAIAEAEGRLPVGAHFEAQDLAMWCWWATKLDFASFLQADPKLVEALRACPRRLVAFTNAPRQYGLRVLETLGLLEDGIFTEDNVCAVDDVMPACKPELEAFAKVLAAVGAAAEECVMVEDSMKNVRAAKALGMKTVLVSGLGVGDAAAGEATKAGDAPLASDPARRPST